MSYPVSKELAPVAGLSPLGAKVAFWLMTSLAVAVAIYLRTQTLTNHDVAWLLSAAEWLLDRRRMSVDFFEVNPPGAVLIYLPAAWLGHLLHMSGDLALEVCVFALAGLTNYFVAARLATRDALQQSSAVIATALTILLLVAPAHEFAQREHIGLLLLLPWIAMCATPENIPHRATRILAGIGMALAVVAKPHFILVPAVLQAVALTRTRKLTSLFSLENLSAGIVLAIYLALVVFAFPDFLTTVLPRASEVYLPARISLASQLLLPSTTLWLLIATVTIYLRRQKESSTSTADAFLIASATGFLIYLLQGKGSEYHNMPSLFLGLIALGLNLVDACRATKSFPVLAVLSGLAILAVIQSYVLHNQHRHARTRELVKVVSRLDPAPRLLAIGADISIGFPLNRMTNGVWVQRQPFLWLAMGSRWLAMTNPDSARLAEVKQRYDRLERQILHEDISKGCPTIILAQDSTTATSWLAWARQDAEFVSLMKDYRLVSTVEDVSVFQRTGPCPVRS